MFVELTDLLRCPREHEDSWLVLAALRTVDRHVLEGTLGCPVCGAEYPVSGGLADFREPGHRGGRASDEESSRVSVPVMGSSEELALMLAAYAALAEPGGTAGIGGALASVAGELERITRARALAINPADGQSPGLSAIRCEGRLPLAADSLRALILDAATAASLDLDAAVAKVRAGGRIVLPAAVSLPSGVVRLAGDDTWTVGERERPTIRLRRA
jgi:uncharacterized protein YbaR (Trm112 family)